MRKIDTVAEAYPYDELFCPVTTRQVFGDRWKNFSLPTGQVMWWHCPACQGWHVSVTELEQ